MHETSQYYRSMLVSLLIWTHVAGKIDASELVSAMTKLHIYISLEESQTLISRYELLFTLASLLLS